MYCSVHLSVCHRDCNIDTTRVILYAMIQTSSPSHSTNVTLRVVGEIKQRRDTRVICPASCGADRKKLRGCSCNWLAEMRLSWSAAHCIHFLPLHARRHSSHSSQLDGSRWLCLIGISRPQHTIKRQEYLWWW